MRGRPGRGLGPPDSGLGKYSLVDVPAPESDPSPEKLELGSEVNEAIGRLPEKYRLLRWVLCYLEGKTYTEAARVLGWAGGTVSGRLSRRAANLRRRLERTAKPFLPGLLAPLASVAAPQPANSLTAAVILAAADEMLLNCAVSHRAAALAKEGVERNVFGQK